MKISTKGRYGLRAMIDLAVHYNEGQVTLYSIAERQEISEGYLEQLLSLLKKAGLVNSTRGHQGGYILAKAPEEITVLSIIEELEGTLSPVHCIDTPMECNRKNVCVSKHVWEKVRNSICSVLASITLKELAEDQIRVYKEEAGKKNTEDDNNQSVCAMIVVKSPNNDINNIAFNGRWLAEKENAIRKTDGVEMQYSVALTEKEQIFVLWEALNNPNMSGYKVYPSVSDLKSDKDLPDRILLLVSAFINVKEDIRFLDI